jgi:hypothetical protein
VTIFSSAVLAVEGGLNGTEMTAACPQTAYLQQNRSIVLPSKQRSWAPVINHGLETGHEGGEQIRGSHTAKRLTVAPPSRALEPQCAALSRVSSTGPISENAFSGAKEERTVRQTFVLILVDPLSF